MRKPESTNTVGAIVRQGRRGEFALSVTRFSRALEAPWHSHSTACLTVVLAGAYEEATRTASRAHTPGVLSYKPAGELHRNRYGADTTTLVIQFDTEEASRAQLELPCLGERFTLIAPEALALGRELSAELRSGEQSLAAQCAILDLINLAGDERAGTRPAIHLASVATAQDWLHANYRHTLDLGEIAGAAGVSACHLSRSFRRTLGCTLGQYQRQLRVARAAELLRRGRLSLAEVAHEVGFSDQSHMTRTFRRHLGLTPGEYRARGR